MNGFYNLVNANIILIICILISLTNFVLVGISCRISDINKRLTMAEIKSKNNIDNK